MAPNSVAVSTSPQNDNGGLGALARDPGKDLVHIEFPDGSVTVNLGPVLRDKIDTKFADNLAESLDDFVLMNVADDLWQGIEDDKQSRREWLEERADGMKHLALKIDKPDTSAEGSQRSTARDSLLLEAVLRFQANAGGELLPADGPVKVRDDKQLGVTEERSAMADDLEADMNHYLTTTATEYYPDTDRMLFQVGFGGTGFKKVYRCPIRRRPVSESVEAPDLIVSSTATDLDNAERVTHVVKMSRATVKRMQIIGAYRDCDLGEPSYTAAGRDSVDEAKEDITGVRKGQRPQDEQFVLYECYALLDLPGFEHEDNKGKATGLPLPYKVVFEPNTKQVLEIRRNWDDGDEMQVAKCHFVKFPFVPGPFGFYDIGLLNIVGNPTMINTALLRILIDAGIFGNFPGFLYAESAGRQERLQFDVMPGQGVPIKTNGQPLNQMVMPLPYKSIDGAVQALMEAITTSGQRLAGTAELQVAEGRQDAPVGTTLAMIEQATKMLDAVHRRLHQAQSREFDMLIALFRENPSDFWKFKRKTGGSDRAWDEEAFIQALDDNDLVPASDPNTSSHLQRIARAQVMVQLAQQDPDKFDKDKVYEIVGKALREPDFMDAVIKGPPPAPPLDPKALAAQTTAQAAMLEAQTKAQQAGKQEQAQQGEQQQQQADRESRERVASMALAKEKMATEGGLAKIHAQATADTLQDRDKQVADHMHDRMSQVIDHVSDHLGQHADRQHDVRMAGLGALLDPKPAAPGGGSDTGSEQ